MRMSRRPPGAHCCRSGQGSQSVRAKRATRSRSRWADSVDYRALWSLGSGQPGYYSFDFWWAYVGCCRRLAAAGVSVRDLDKALWAYSEANQPTGTR